MAAEGYEIISTPADAQLTISNFATEKQQLIKLINEKVSGLKDSFD